MPSAETRRLLRLWDAGICPNCGKRFSPARRVGSGRKADGGFCSLDCYAVFYRLELEERARRLHNRATPRKRRG